MSLLFRFAKQKCNFKKDLSFDFVLLLFPTRIRAVGFEGSESGQLCTRSGPLKQLISLAPRSSCRNFTPTPTLKSLFNFILKLADNQLEGLEIIFC